MLLEEAYVAFFFRLYMMETVKIDRKQGVKGNDPSQNQTRVAGVTRRAYVAYF